MTPTGPLDVTSQGCCLVVKPCPALCDPVVCSLPGSSGQSVRYKCTSESWATPFPTRTIEVSGLEDHWGRQSGEQFETGKGQTWPCEVFQKHFQSCTPRRGLTIFFTLSLRKTSKLWNQSGHFFPLCVETEFWFYHINCRFYFTELDLKQIPQSTLCPERKILTNLDFLGVGSWN